MFDAVEMRSSNRFSVMLQFFSEWKVCDPACVDTGVYPELITGSALHTPLLRGLNTKQVFSKSGSMDGLEMFAAPKCSRKSCSIFRFFSSVVRKFFSSILLWS